MGWNGHFDFARYAPPYSGGRLLRGKVGGGAREWMKILGRKKGKRWGVKSHFALDIWFIYMYSMYI